MEKNYTTYAFWITLLVILLLAGAGFLRAFTLGGVFFKRVNIVSDVVKFPDDPLAPAAESSQPDRSFLAESQQASDPRALEQARQMPSPETQTWDLEGAASSGDTAAETSVIPAADTSERVVRIEDFSEGSVPSVRSFCRLLGRESRQRVVRIAFLGDSFIEGDIITADVREQLQTLFGGQGVGFVPFATPFAANRATVRHSSQGWKTYNLIYKKAVPRQMRDRFYVSGMLCVPEKGAFVRYRGVDFRRHIASAASARLLFVNGAGSEIDLVVNDTIRRSFTPATTPLVQQICLSGDIRDMRIKILRPEGFVGYGVVFEGTSGICVDNYALRSNSGLALFGTSSSINSQIGRALGYDLIVLEYGLNAMDPHVTDYKAYGGQLEKIIRYVQACFPESAVLVMGVGDRSTFRDGTPVTMPGVQGMLARQREAARACGVAFWNTFLAMGGENSMPSFVKKGWAAKDYTHLGYRGGKVIADEFVKALLHVARSGTGGHTVYDSLPGPRPVSPRLLSNQPLSNQPLSNHPVAGSSERDDSTRESGQRAPRPDSVRRSRPDTTKHSRQEEGHPREEGHSLPAGGHAAAGDTLPASTFRPQAHPPTAKPVSAEGDTVEKQ